MRAELGHASVHLYLQSLSNFQLTAATSHKKYAQYWASLDTTGTTLIQCYAM